MKKPTSEKATSTANYTALDSNEQVIAIADAAAVPPTTQRVEVTAPETLIGGYDLHVDLNGAPAVVRVVSLSIPLIASIWLVSRHYYSVHVLGEEHCTSHNNIQQLSWPHLFSTPSLFRVLF